MNELIKTLKKHVDEQDKDNCDARITIQNGVVYGEAGEGFDCRWLNSLVPDIDKFCDGE